MSSIVVHKLIMACKSSACPPAPPEAKLGTTFGAETGGLISPGTFTGTPVGSNESMGATGEGVKAGTSGGLERLLAPPSNEVMAFACALSAILFCFGLARKLGHNG